MMRAVILAAALMVISSSAWAWDFRSGDNLLSQCQNPKALGEWGLCWSCIAPGSLDTSLSHAAGLSDIAVCHA